MQLGFLNSRDVPGAKPTAVGEWQNILPFSATIKNMQELRRGSRGDQVTKWQSFLHGFGGELGIDGIFGETTEAETKRFQRENQIKADGVVGALTYAAALQMGFPAIQFEAFPPRPAFNSPSSAEREKMFGKFRYQVAANGAIKITDGWAINNIVKVFIPQLIGIEGAPKDGMVSFHRAGADQLKALFAAWQKAGLLKYLKSWAGSFVPRMVRGSKTQLSNHAFGSAFDINAAWNGLGKTPAAADKEGTVIPLVKIANEHGFFWGGHYNSRKDGMHFELAVLGMFPKQVDFKDLDDDEIELALEDSTTDDNASFPPEEPSGVSAQSSDVPQKNTWEIIADKLSNIQKTAEKVNEVKESLSNLPGISSLPGMRVNDEPMKVTSGKSTSFFLNVLGMVLSILGAVWGFLTNNFRLIALGIVGFIVLIIIITIAFTVINALKMKYHSDPTKYNVE